MPSRDNKFSIDPYLLDNIAISGNGNNDSVELDIADFDGGVTIQAYLNIFVDGVYTLQIHASDTSGFTPAAGTLLSGDNLIDQSGTLILDTAIQVEGARIASLGFITAKRYVVVRIVASGVSSGGSVQVLAQCKPEIKKPV